MFIARGEHLDAILAQGLRLETPEGELVIHPAEATDDPAQVGIVDIVIAGVKSWQLKDAAHAMKPLIGSETFVLPLQNGIEAAAQLSEVLGPEHVVGGLCATFSWIDGPGRIRCIGQMHFVRFAELDNVPSNRIEGMRKAFERAGVDVKVPSDIQAALWEKFLFVVSFGGVEAVTRAPIGVIRTVPEARQMLERCMHEINEVARARQIALSDGITESMMERVDSLDPSATTSLQRDITNGKPSELEAWNGPVVSTGAQVGVATPLHEFIYHSPVAFGVEGAGEGANAAIRTL